PTPTVSVSRVADASEPSTAGSFRFTRTGDTTAALTVNYTVTGTATAGTDYTALSGTVSFAAGAATVDVPVIPIDDTTFEGVETVTVSVLSGPDFTGGGSATLNIADNDTTPPAAPPSKVLVVTGPAGGPALLFTPSSGRYPATGQSVTPFPGFSGVPRAASADVNGDGVEDRIFVTGPGDPARFTVISGADNTTVLVPPTDP